MVLYASATFSRLGTELFSSLFLNCCCFSTATAQSIALRSIQLRYLTLETPFLTDLCPYNTSGLSKPLEVSFTQNTKLRFYLLQHYCCSQESVRLSLLWFSFQHQKHLRVPSRMNLSQERDRIEMRKLDATRLLLLVLFDQSF